MLSLSQLCTTVKGKQWLLWITGVLLTLLSCPIVISSPSSLEHIETHRFVFLCHPQAQKAGFFLARRAESIADELSQLLGFSLRSKVAVILLPAGYNLKTAVPDLPAPPSWATGAAYSEQNTILIFIRARSDLEKTFRHELHHILLGQAFQGSHRVPRWLDEGLAILQADEWSPQRLMTMTQAVLSGRVIPMDRLVRNFPADPWAAEIAYCQSFYFISFLKGRFGNNAFRKFLRTYSSHGDFHAAMHSAYGRSWEEIEVDWRAYLRVRFNWIPVITSTSTLWFIAALLFVAGYILKRKKTRLRLMELQQAEESEHNDTSL